MVLKADAHVSTAYMMLLNIVCPNAAWYVVGMVQLRSVRHVAQCFMLCCPMLMRRVLTYV